MLISRHYPGATLSPYTTLFRSMSVQKHNGVVDIAVADEAEAVAVAKKYLSYFQGPIDTWDAPDQRALRHVIPEDRDRKSTRLNSSHLVISYAVFCLKKKINHNT